MSDASNQIQMMISGRLVWVIGDLFKGKPKVDDQTKQVRLGKDGQPLQEYGFGLAVRKDDPNFQLLWENMQKAAMVLYPSGLPKEFAWKYDDGDGTDHNGKPFNTRQGYAGCIVIKCTTTIPIKFFRFDTAKGQHEIMEAGIKCGDYVDVSLNIKAHPPISKGKPGLYLNPYAVRFNSYGEAIINAPSGDNIFGQGPTNMMGSATPIGNSAPMPSAAPSFPSPAPQQQFGQPATPAPQPQAPVQPHYGVMPQQFQPQPQAPAPMPAPTAQPPLVGPAPLTGMPATTAAPTGMPPFPGMPR